MTEFVLKAGVGTLGPSLALPKDPQGQPHWILNHRSQRPMLCENQSASSGGAKASLPRQRCPQQVTSLEGVGARLSSYWFPLLSSCSQHNSQCYLLFLFIHLFFFFKAGFLCVALAASASQIWD